MRVRICILLAIATVITFAVQGQMRAADWPMWRYDAGRTAGSPQELRGDLHLQWTIDYPKLDPAWPDEDRMIFDTSYEPIVLGKTVYIASPRSDSVTALSTRTGEMKWRFYTDGPIRLAPAAWNGKLYVGSDDGYLYCLDAESGEVIWRFRGARSDRKVLGNKRLISTWPVRGGPAVMD